VQGINSSQVGFLVKSKNKKNKIRMNKEKKLKNKMKQLKVNNR